MRLELALEPEPEPEPGPVLVLAREVRLELALQLYVICSGTICQHQRHRKATCMCPLMQLLASRSLLVLALQ